MGRLWPLRRPDLLASRQGRLGLFFALYITEGLPLGFAVTAVAYHLRRMGVGPAEIGAFVASFYLPWAFKWAFGPLVDVFRSRRWGHRRAWILATQVFMAATLMVLVWVPLPTGLALFTAILLVHNTAAAMQDVAIDALACSTLREDERGVANGLMFAGAALGQALGGSGVLLLSGVVGFQGSFFLVAGAILVVSALVVAPLREPPVPDSAEAVPALRAMHRFSLEAFSAFLSSKAALAGVGFALLPAGAMALGLALRSNLSAEFGLDEAETGRLELVCNLVAAVGMVVGGWLSDRWGRRSTLAVYLALMSLPTAWLAWQLQELGYEGSRSAGAREPALAAVLWTASVAYSVCMGLMYGTRSAIMMDVTRPQVAGTQFTAYMAMMNVAIALSATWQGVAVEAIGYPKTLWLDALAGLCCLLLLPYLRAAGEPDLAASQRRAQAVAGLLAFLCALWPWFALEGPALGAARGVVDSLYTLVFVSAAVVVWVGSALQGEAPSRATAVLAVALLALYARRWGADQTAVLGLTTAVSWWAAARLLRLSRVHWSGLAAH